MERMKAIRALALVALLAALVVSASPAVAGDPPCSGMMTAAHAALDDVEFTSRMHEKDEARLHAKLDAAEDKLDAGKYADAVRKLRDAWTKLDTLSSTGKAEDVSGAMAAIEAAMACITPYIAT